MTACEAQIRTANTQWICPLILKAGNLEKKSQMFPSLCFQQTSELVVGKLNLVTLNVCFFPCCVGLPKVMMIRVPTGKYEYMLHFKITWEGRERSEMEARIRQLQRNLRTKFKWSKPVNQHSHDSCYFEVVSLWLNALIVSCFG